MRVGACLQGVPYTRPDFGRVLKVAVEQGLAAYYHVYAMPKKPVRQSRTSRSRREVEPPQQPHIVSFRLNPSEFEQLNSHLAEIGPNRSDFIRPAVMSAVLGQMSFTEVMPMAVRPENAHQSLLAATRYYRFARSTRFRARGDTLIIPPALPSTS